MAILNPVLKPIFSPTITLVLLSQKTRTVSGSFTYIQSDATNYFQPDGSSLYLIP